MTDADLLAERDALLGIAQGPVPRDMLKDRSRRHHAQRVIANRVNRLGWPRDLAETVPLGQKRGPKPLPPEERAERDRARWRAQHARVKAAKAARRADASSM